ncbi:MAG: hypothetical protein IJ791_07170 [Lachnospiraceae bacterium]|nr:hypothetical protein [Lachnospiraceae bacterium]
MKCNNCGNVFDERKYHNICPKCGLFQSELEQNGSYQYEETPGFEVEADDIKDFNTGFEKVDIPEMEETTEHQNEKAPGKNGNKKKQNTAHQAVQAKEKEKINRKPYFIVMGCCVLLSICINSVMPLNVENKKSEFLKSAETLNYETMEAVLGTPFAYGESTMVVDACETVNPELAAPFIAEGQKLIQVSYHFENYVWDSNTDDAKIFVYDPVADQYKANFLETLAEENLRTMKLSKGLADTDPREHTSQDTGDMVPGYFLFSVDEKADEVTLVLGIKEGYFNDDNSGRRDIQHLKERQKVVCPITSATMVNEAEDE